MGELYTEWIVKKKTPVYAIPAKIAMIILTGIPALLALTGIVWWMIIPAVIFGYITYRLFMNWDIEYEYVFVNGELDIDKIMGKSRRRRCLTIDMEDIEIIAAEGSHFLDSYKNKKCKQMDFSSSIKENKKYLIYGNHKNESTRIVFEPNEKMLDNMRSVSPRKVNL
ncbi:MAG: hypothetical protein GX913_07850 [Clostridiales bacterium]|nr:hypothetical protein [Clostridiales bacterium]